jgi:hypothetical protein
MHALEIRDDEPAPQGGVPTPPPMQELPQVELETILLAS